MHINMYENARYDHIVCIVSTKFMLAIMTGIMKDIFTIKMYSLDPLIVLLLIDNSAAESLLF
jgi:hypothetical protein